MHEPASFESSMPDSSLTEFESELSALRPRPAAVDRDGLMFQAGRQAALRQEKLRQAALLPRSGGGAAPRWLWPCVAGVSAAAACVLAVILAVRGEPEVIPEVVYVEQPAEERASVPAGADDKDDHRKREDRAAERTGPLDEHAPAEAVADRAFTRGFRNAAVQRWSEVQLPGMLRDRNLALALGVNALPQRTAFNTSADVSQPASLANLRAELIGRAPGGGD